MEHIKAHQCQGQSKELQYLIKWKGYTEADNTWEPADQVYAPELIKAYYKSIPQESIKALLKYPRTALLLHPGSYTASLSLFLYYSQVPCLHTKGLCPYHPHLCPQTSFLLLQTTLPISCLTTNLLTTTTHSALNPPTDQTLTSLIHLTMVTKTVTCPSSMEES